MEAYKVYEQGRNEVCKKTTLLWNDGGEEK